MAYQVVADVNGQEEQWAWETGMGETQRMREFWHKMKRTRRTPDTDSPVFSARLYRNGKQIDALLDDGARP